MAAPGALIAFSAAPGRTAEDGPPGGHSIYTRHLAQAMRAEGVEVEEMLKSVRVQVLRETQERQIPWVNTSMVVNFSFNPGLVAAGARGNVQVAVAPAALPGARSLRLTMQAERLLNTDRQDGPASLALRVYVLRDAQAFQRASFDSLYDNDEATLGAALLRRETVHLRPGEQRELLLALGNDAHVIAVFAAYRELDRTQWRTQLSIPTDEAVPVARLDAMARQVQLAWVP
jgi:type VI secretion system VasD/TssJ family lipoprotein